MRFCVLLLMASVFLSAHANQKYLDSDKSCPALSETVKYIDVPMFHDLEKIAQVENITNLKLHEDLQRIHKGKSFKVYYEFLAPYDENKELLILIPGGPGQTHTFLHQFEEELEGFSEFAKDYNVLVMDHRGIGCSRYFGPGSYPPESLLMRQAASDVEQIRKVYGEKAKINVWGYSYGSMLAQTYALLYPQNLSKLFLGGAFSAASDFVDAMKTFEQRVLNASPALLDDYSFLKKFYPTYSHKLLKVAERYMYKYSLFKKNLVELAADVASSLKMYDFKQADKLLRFEKPSVMEWMTRSISCIEIFPNKLEDGMFPMFWESFSSCKEFEGQTDYFNYTQDLANIDVPTFIWGAEFDHVTTATAMRKMSKVIPNNYLYIDEHIGHLMDKPICFVEMMRSFFSHGIDRQRLDKIKNTQSCASAPEIKGGHKVESLFGIGVSNSIVGPL